MRNTNNTDSKLRSIDLVKLAKVTGGCGGGDCHRHRWGGDAPSVSVTVATGGAVPQ